MAGWAEVDVKLRILMTLFYGGLVCVGAECGLGVGGGDCCKSHRGMVLVHWVPKLSRQSHHGLNNLEIP